MHCTFLQHLFRIVVVVCKGRDPSRADVTMFVHGDIFFSDPAHPRFAHWSDSSIHSQWNEALNGEARRQAMDAKCTISVCGCVVSLNQLSACGSPCKIFSNFIFRGLLPKEFLLGFFIGLRGGATAICAFALATFCTTLRDTLK